MLSDKEDIKGEEDYEREQEDASHDEENEEDHGGRGTVFCGVFIWMYLVLLVLDVCMFCLFAVLQSKSVTKKEKGNWDVFDPWVAVVSRSHPFGTESSEFVGLQTSNLPNQHHFPANKITK